MFGYSYVLLVYVCVCVCLCVCMLLSLNDLQLKAACNGDLTKVKRIVKLVGFVMSDQGFYNQPKV